MMLMRAAKTYPAFVVLIALTAIGGLIGRTAWSDGGVYSATKHGSATSGVERLVGPDFPRGACVQCHYQHASMDGAATGTAYPYLLFAPNDNGLCSSIGCHSGYSANRLFQGPDLYRQAAHVNTPGMVWPGPLPWARKSAELGNCINCHDPHGFSDTQGLIPAMTFSREEKLCLTCHDGSPAHTNIQREVTKSYRHPAGDYAGRHTQAEGPDFNRYGQANRHAECEDCHNVHYLRSQTGAPTPPTASERIRGVSYLEVINGAAFTIPTYVYHAPDDPTPAQYEYQLCFKCHSSWTILPLTSPSGRAPSDKAKQFNPNNPSYHPVEAPGKQTGAVIENSLLAPYTASSTIFCSDCHASDSSTAPRGPHGSSNRFLLKANYTVTELRSSYLSSDFALCYTCHSESALLDESENSVNTNFRFHRKHLQEEKGNRSTLPVCASCHGDSHGSQRERLIDFSQEAHLESFISWNSQQAGGGVGQCSLTCHGERHDRETY